MKRTVQHRYAILGALHEHGNCTGWDLCKILHRGPGAIYPDLGYLENDGLIVAYWVEQGENQPRRRFYRIATPDERSDFRRRRRIKQAAPTLMPRRRVPWGAAWQPGAAR